MLLRHPFYIGCFSSAFPPAFQAGRRPCVSPLSSAALHRPSRESFPALLFPVPGSPARRLPQPAECGPFFFRFLNDLVYRRRQQPAGGDIQSACRLFFPFIFCPFPISAIQAIQKTAARKLRPFYYGSGESITVPGCRRIRSRRSRRLRTYPGPRTEGF